MIKAKIQDSVLQEAAGRGMDEFLTAVTSAIYDAAGGGLTPETMSRMSADQITLLAYGILREELMDGGFVQLIHNGYGGFIFKNPFAKAVRGWGLDALAQLIQKAHKYYTKYHAMIERDMSDEDFMALFEQCPEFDDMDDLFVADEERFTSMVAYYVDEHLADFVEVTQ